MTDNEQEQQKALRTLAAENQTVTLPEPTTAQLIAWVKRMTDVRDQWAAEVERRLLALDLSMDMVDRLQDERDELRAALDQKEPDERVGRYLALE